MRLPILLSAALVASLAAVPAEARPSCFGRRATIVVRDHVYKVEGTPRADTIVIADRGSARRVFPGRGDDYLCIHGDGPEASFLLLAAGRGDDRAKVFGFAEVVLRGEAGRDRLVGAGEPDNVEGGKGNDALYGGGSFDYVAGGPGRDRVFGGEDGDRVAGYEGNDFVSGGSGDDVVWYHRTTFDGKVLYDAGGVKVDLRRGTARARDGRDRLLDVEQVVGSNGDDVVTGDGLDNHLHALGGDDRIEAGGGDDWLYDVPDELRGTYRSGDDVFRGGGGEDHVLYETFEYAGRAVRVDLAAGIARGLGRDTLGAIEHVIATSGDDSLLGDEGDNDLFGGNGDDDLDGREGDDHLDGGNGEDTCANGEGAVNCEG
jgi:Ca2+-binding RTX toxin-like protein